MALNWRDLPEGEAPASSQPVFQNIGAAGAQWEGLKDIGAAVGQLGEIHEQYRQRRLAQNEAYLSQKFEDITRQQRLDFAQASSAESLNADPEAARKQAEGFNFGALRDFNREALGTEVSEGFRKLLGERLSSTAEFVSTQGQNATTQWASKSKSEFMRASARENADRGIMVDPDFYAQGVADTDPEVARVQAQEINRHAQYVFFAGQLASDGTPADIAATMTSISEDKFLGTAERVQLASDAKTALRNYQIGANKQAVDAARVSMANARVDLAGIGSKEKQGQFANVLVQAARVPEAEKHVVLQQLVASGLATDEQVARYGAMPPEGLLAVAKEPVAAAARAGDGMTPGNFATLLGRVNAGSATFGEIYEQFHAGVMNRAQYEEATQALELRENLFVENLSGAKDKGRRAIARILSPDVMSGDTILSTRDMQRLFTILQTLPNASKSERDAYTRMVASALASAEAKDGEYQAGQKGGFFRRNLPFTSVRSQAEIKARDSVFDFLGDPSIRNTLYNSNLQSSLTDAQNALDEIWGSKDDEGRKTERTKEYLTGLRQRVGDKQAEQAVQAAALAPAPEPTTVPDLDNFDFGGGEE